MTSLSSVGGFSSRATILPHASWDHPNVQASHQRPTPQLINLGDQGLRHPPLPFPTGHTGLRPRPMKPKRIHGIGQLFPDHLGSETSGNMNERMAGVRRPLISVNGPFHLPPFRISVLGTLGSSGSFVDHDCIALGDGASDNAQRSPDTSCNCGDKQ